LTEPDDAGTGETQQLTADLLSVNEFIAKYMNRKFLELDEQQRDNVTQQ
jgi:hypothetical protein